MSANDWTLADFRRHVPRIIAERDEARARVTAVETAIIAEIDSWQHHVSEDCWYTCPAATEDREGETCCNDATVGTGCDCGLDARRARLRAALAAASPPKDRQDAATCEHGKSEGHFYIGSDYRSTWCPAAASPPEEPK